MPNERRRHPRVRVHLPVTLDLQGGGRIDAHVSDLSVGGAFIEAEASPPMGTQASLVIQMPGDKQLAIDGTIRWAKPNGIGVQFGLLGVRETYALSEFLSDLEPMPDSRRLS